MFDALTPDWRLLRPRLPAALRHLDRSALREDLMAAATVAMVSIPQAVDFALIAGLPPSYGAHLRDRGWLRGLVVFLLPASRFRGEQLAEHAACGDLRRASGLGAAAGGDRPAAAALAPAAPALARGPAGAPVFFRLRTVSSAGNPSAWPRWATPVRYFPAYPISPGFRSPSGSLPPSATCWSPPWPQALLGTKEAAVRIFYAHAESSRSA